MLTTTQHEAGLYRERVAELVSNAPFVARPELRLSEWLARSEAYLRAGKYGVGLPPYLVTYADIVSVLVWCEFIAAAGAVVAEVESKLGYLNQDERSSPRVEQWRARERGGMLSQSAVLAMVQQQIAELKLTSLPCHDFIIDCDQHSLPNFRNVIALNSGAG
jgi:hypothetical protein